MISQLAARFRTNLEQVILGKTEEINLCLAALFAGGHILLEDVPGTGKTELCKALARSLGGQFARIQFTPDLLPGQLTGLSVYHPGQGTFSFRPGSLFANVILADEINRATPRTQSGLLESMEEQTVSVDGVTHPLPKPYFVVATQNPVETQGTFPLPEAQLDRFLLRLHLGYPNREAGEQILNRFVRGQDAPELTPVCTMEELESARAAVRTVYLHPDILRYLADLAEATRTHKDVALGLSTRGLLALTRATQAWAAIQDRDYAIPEDAKTLAPYVITHRLMIRGGRSLAATVLTEILNTLPVPVEDWKQRVGETS